MEDSRAKNSLQPDFGMMCGRGVGLGRWEAVRVCSECGLRGSLYHGLHFSSVCPKCGSRNSIREHSGRFVKGKRFLLVFRRRGHWELHSEVFPEKYQPLKATAERVYERLIAEEIREDK